MDSAIIVVACLVAIEAARNIRLVMKMKVFTNQKFLDDFKNCQFEKDVSIVEKRFRKKIPKLLKEFFTTLVFSTHQQKVLSVERLVSIVNRDIRRNIVNLYFVNAVLLMFTYMYPDMLEPCLMLICATVFADRLIINNTQAKFTLYACVYWKPYFYRLSVISQQKNQELIQRLIESNNNIIRFAETDNLATQEYFNKFNSVIPDIQSIKATLNEIYNLEQFYIQYSPYNVLAEIADAVKNLDQTVQEYSNIYSAARQDITNIVNLSQNTLELGVTYKKILTDAGVALTELKSFEQDTFDQISAMLSEFVSGTHQQINQVMNELSADIKSAAEKMNGNFDSYSVKCSELGDALQGKLIDNICKIDSALRDRTQKMYACIESMQNVEKSVIAMAAANKRWIDQISSAETLSSQDGFIAKTKKLFRNSSEKSRQINTESSLFDTFNEMQNDMSKLMKDVELLCKGADDNATAGK